MQEIVAIADAAAELQGLLRDRHFDEHDAAAIVAAALPTIAMRLMVPEMKDMLGAASNVLREEQGGRLEGRGW
jgi:hypothetical protein